ncbi:MAG: hypothetical protein GEU77_16030 [Deltaproteobacteria bacterium]|nr:hypothetical protein [Deltaproteobacteria bacterium]
MGATARGQISLTVLFSLLLYTTPAFATSIVALVGEKTITIAADGVLVGNSVETGELVRVSTCKIRCVNFLCFAASGLYDNKKIGYNLWLLAEKELHHGRSPQEAAKQFHTVISPIIPRLLHTSRKETPDRYAEWLEGLCDSATISDS